MRQTRTYWIGLAGLVFVFALFGQTNAGSPGNDDGKKNASGGDESSGRSVLAVHPSYPGLFRDPTGKPLLLIGNYSWGMFSCESFDYVAMLDTLQGAGLNFARVWLFWGDEVPPGMNPKTGKPLFNVVPYARTGPGSANDGRPKYDLDRFDPVFFKRLRDVCQAAQDRGVYLQLCIFDGWLLKGSRWSNHAYQRDNNINGVDGDPNRTGRGRDNEQGYASLANPPAMSYQKALIREVVDTVNHFDHLLFEIANENANPQWELHLCEYLHEYERSKPKQHLVMPMDLPNHGGQLGVTQTWDPRRLHAGILEKRPLGKPQIFDTDWTISSDDDQIRRAMWSAVLGGAHFDYLDAAFQPDDSYNGEERGRSRARLRNQIGILAAFARRIRFWEMSPDASVVAEGYAFAFSSPSELALYLPAGGQVVLNAGKPKVLRQAFWHDPRTGVWKSAGSGAELAPRRFTAPDGNDWLLYLRDSTETRPPGVATAIRAAALSATSVRVRWTPSQDDIAAAGYQVFRNGRRIAASATPGYLDTRLEPQTKYSYAVVAYDLSGAASARSAESASVVTPRRRTSFRVALGSPYVSEGLSLLTNRDGDTESATIDGVSCRAPVDDGDKYFYLAIDDEHLFDEPGTTLFLKATYYDATGFIEPQYDSAAEPYVNAKRISLTGTNAWKTAEWTLTDGRFADRQNAGADLRLHVGAQRVFIKSVEASLVAFPRAEE